MRLARSEACLNQAFAVGDRVLALQFHLETTVESAMGLIHGSAADLVPGRYVQTAAAMLAEPGRFGVLHRLMASVLDGLAGNR